MDFCEVCDNLLYLKTSPEMQLVKYCKHCKFEKIAMMSDGAVKISESLYSEDDLLYLQYQNKYLRYDPSLPRVSDPALACPNRDCTGPKDAPQALYIKYHPVHMKYLYCCDYCGETWKK